MKEHIKGGALTEVTLYILLSLYTPNHGYGIMQFIEEKTHGRLVLGAGTLYGALTSLVSKEWITLVEEESSRKKKIYIITDLGRDMVKKEMERLQDTLTLALELTKEKELN